MKTKASLWVGLVVTAVVATACNDYAGDDSTTAPYGVGTSAATGDRRPDLAGCEFLAAPDRSNLVMSAFGVGVQIYHWNGASWGTATPSATLYQDAGLHGVVATHFAGPTWQSNSGGKVVGTVLNRCTPDAASIPWLSLSGVADGPGVLQHVTFIQRLHTVGGNAPSAPGTTIGQEARIPYTADYLFYKVE